MANSCLCPITERSPPPVRPFCHKYSSSQPRSQSLPLVKQSAKDEFHEQEGKGVSQGTPYSACQENRTHQETATMGQRIHQKLLLPTDMGTPEAMLFPWHWVASWNLPHKSQHNSSAVMHRARQFCSLHCFQSLEETSVIFVSVWMAVM